MAQELEQPHRIVVGVGVNVPVAACQPLLFVPVLHCSAHCTFASTEVLGWTVREVVSLPLLSHGIDLP